MNLDSGGEVLDLVFGKCGNVCSHCPWSRYVRERSEPSAWDSYVKEVRKYVGYVPAKNPCHGCQTPDDKLAKNVGVHNFLRGCSARKCAFHCGVENCAYCSRYPCDKIEIMNASYTTESVEKRIGETLSNDKYEAYVKIFQGMKQLDKIRASLSADDLVSVKTVEIKTPRMTEFPKDLSVSKKEMKAYRILHQTLTDLARSDLGLKDTDTIATQDVLKTRRAIIFRLLWILGLYGELDETGASMNLGSIEIQTHKKGTKGMPNTEDSWMRLFNIMGEAGIKCEIVPQTKELYSPLNWLRDRILGTEESAWLLRASFDEALGGFQSLKTLQESAKTLDSRYGKRAYSRFAKADMRTLAA
ncbi:MAG: DUF3795 domain-containing protein [Candidatus Thorarchaeota archaeon]